LSSSSTVTAIPDYPATAIEIPFVVSGTGTVGEVTFSLFLTHTYVGDLVITLVHPDNSTVILSNNAGSGATSLTAPGAAFGSSCGTYLTFSDLGTASIDAQVAQNGAPIVGTFQPSFPLSAFTGKALPGTWKLRIQDTGPGDTGTFQCGTLTVKPFASGPSLDVNNDGVVDLQDLLFFAKYYGTTNVSCLFSGDSTVSDADLTILLAGL
jgi:subtilisin-like proprotein convertase family protein